MHVKVLTDYYINRDNIAVLNNSLDLFSRANSTIYFIVNRL